MSRFQRRIETDLADLTEVPNLAKKKHFFSRASGVEKCWVGYGNLGRPRDQGDCRACVAFVVCDLVSAFLVQRMEWGFRGFTAFSPQYPVDCMRNSREKKECGCREATYEEIMSFFMYKGGVEESVYPYQFKRCGCRDPDCAGDVTPPRDVFVQPTKSEKGSSSSSRTKVSRKGKEPRAVQAKPADHAILIIGYGRDRDTNTDYYIIKNSWGSKWGYLGYAKVDVNFFEGLAYYPISVTYPV